LPLLRRRLPVRRRRPERGAAAAPAADDATAIRLAALKLLNRRDFCAAELTARLIERGAGPQAAAEVVAGLGRERLVDDARYAEHYVAWHAGRGQGPVRIAHELRELGVAPALIEQAVDAGSASWRERCAKIRRRRFADEPPKDWKERARQARFLQYRGFSADQVRAALGNDVELDE
jgi:regulatory protein